MLSYQVTQHEAKRAAMLAINAGVWISLEPWPYGTWFVRLKDEPTKARRYLDRRAA